MRASTSLVVLAVASVTTACGYRELPPPAAPAPIVPDVPEAPTEPPPEGMGRLLLETDGEPAKVARVTERSDPPSGYGGYPAPVTTTIMPNGTRVVTVAPYGIKSELLCITPCAVDARTGAETLVFTSTREPYRTSMVDVAVPRGTTVVRHHIGKETPYSMGYGGGALLTLVGGGLTLMGSVAFAIGATSSPTIDQNGHRTDPRAIEVAGAVIGTVGLATLIGGILLMTSNRPERQPGATTTFRVPASPPAFSGR